MRLLLLMLFACGEKEVATDATTATNVVETQTLETTDEKNTDASVEVTKDATVSTSGESEAEVKTTSTNTNKGVNND